MPDTQGLPWPEGDPGAVRAAGHRASALAPQLGALHSSVASTHAAGWSGTAAAAFGATIVTDAAAVASAASAFGDAAGALGELAAALEHARERVRHAAARLREAREHAQQAAARAADARAAAAAAHAAAALDPSSALGGPFALQADAAEGEALRAEAASAAAQDELARVQAWAEREAADACHDARAADNRCAGVLDGAAGIGAFGGTGIPGGGGYAPAGGIAMAGMAPIGQLGRYLAADVYNFWSGGHDQYFPFGTGTKAVLTGKGVVKWINQDWRAYNAAVRGAGADSAAALQARGAMLERLPTFNNGFVGQKLAAGLSRIPATAGAGEWLSTASKATPWFRALGVGGGVVSTGLGAYGLYEQGNPIKAVEKRGAGYVADVGKTAFSASTTAFLVAPNPVTGGAVVVSGAVWLGAEGWEHREQIAHGIATAADWTWDHGKAAAGYVWDHSAPGEIWNNREQIGHALDQGVDTIGDGLSTAVDGAQDLVDKIPTPW